MKYILLFILASSFTLKTYCQNSEPKVNFLLEAEINNSFIENQNINSDMFNPKLSLGFGLNGLLDIRLTSSIHFLTGLRITSSSYNYYFDTRHNKSGYIGGTLPLYFEYAINTKNRIGVGTDLSYQSESNPGLTDYESDNVTPRTEIIKNGFPTLITPLVLNYSRYFSTEKGRVYALSLYLKKGLQTQETIYLKEYQDGIVIKESSFDYKGTNIAVAFRYYLKRKA